MEENLSTRKAQSQVQVKVINLLGREIELQCLCLALLSWHVRVTEWE